jgi:hypothetical protein
VELNLAFTLTFIKEQTGILSICSTTAEIPHSMISNLKLAIIKCYKARLQSIRTELAAFPQGDSSL